MSHMDAPTHETMLTRDIDWKKEEASSLESSVLTRCKGAATQNIMVHVSPTA